MPLTILGPSPHVPGSSRIAVNEIRCSTLIHPLNYRSSTEYTINLYRGCTHGCVYCYAPSLIHDERRWGNYVDVKVNAPAVLERELRGLKREEVFLSSASDPYQPVEAKYRITRRCLETLLRHRFPVSVLTRSPLVLRDLDLLREFDRVRVGMSITSVPTRRFEPGVPPLRRRIETLKRLSSTGIRTWVSLAPVIPGMVMVEFDELFRELSEAGVQSVGFGVLRFAGYEASRMMFEAATGMSAAEALEGREALVAKLSDLVRRYGMEPKDDTTEWRNYSDGPVSLDSFTLPGAAGSPGSPT